MKRRFFQTVSLLMAFIMAFGCAGCATVDNGNASTYTASGTALDTFVSITLYGCGSQQLANDTLDLCSYYEKIFSRVNEDALLARANEAGGFLVNSDESKILKELIQEGLLYCEMTDGALDLTVEPLSSLWNFGENTDTVPSTEEIAEALEKVDYHRITIKDAGDMSLERAAELGLKAGETCEGYVDFGGARLELGAIAKGYIADRMRDSLLEAGVSSALINLGGNILTIGTKFGTTAFSVGIQKPFGAGNELAKILSVSDLSLVTSGVYERYFYVEDTLYHHILDPKTGYPMDNGLYSMTILSKDSTKCDALSTACFVMGEVRAMEFLEKLEDVEAVWIDHNNELHYTEGAAQYFK